jgi:hypothetical protein
LPGVTSHLHDFAGPAVRRFFDEPPGCHFCYSGNLQLRRDACCEFDQLVIQKRNACFETPGHGHTVDALRLTGSSTSMTRVSISSALSMGRVALLAVPDSCSPWVGLTLKSMSSTMPRGGLRPCTRSIHWPDKSARAERFSAAASHCVSKRPIWLGEAAQP